MNSKAIRKQLLAAVAMVLVAAVALGSSTYAWFAANNQVKANMASIKAISDAAFLEISKTATTTEQGDGENRTTVTNVTWNNLTTVEISSGDNSKELLPARYKADSATMFETAFASAPTASTMLAGSAKDITAETLNKYVWKETVYIRAQSGSFNNLSVSALAVEKVTDDSGLISAGRILAKCGDKVQVWKSGDSKATAKVAGDEYLYTGASASDYITTDKYVTVDLYFYYDGDDANVYTNNITGLKAIKSSITFTADQVTT